MKINSINTYSYSNINNNKQYASRPVFKTIKETKATL